MNEIHYNLMRTKYGEKSIEPNPLSFPELPIDENNVLRPMSPYATSKVFGDYAARNYNISYGIDTVISRAFNHEGAGRGKNFVTSSIVKQIVSIYLEETTDLKIGDVTSFLPFGDWSHIEDIVNGYVLLADRADPRSVYVQGSMRTNSVLSMLG